MAAFAANQQEAADFQATMNAFLSFGWNTATGVVGTAFPGAGMLPGLIGGGGVGALLTWWGKRKNQATGAKAVVTHVDTLREVSPKLDEAFRDLTEKEKKPANEVLAETPAAAEVVANS